MSTEPTERIGGWLWAPLVWLLVALLSLTVTMLLLTGKLMQADLQLLNTADLALVLLSVFIVAVLWCYTSWLTVSFFKRRSVVPKHYIIWLLIYVLLAVKTFAFDPVPDTIALRELSSSLLAAALLVPYFKRSTRVKRTFVNP